MKLVQNQSGVSLIAAIFIIVILAFMGLVFLTLFTTTSSTSINELQSTQAMYVAEGGLEYGINQLINNPAYVGDTNKPLGSSGTFTTSVANSATTVTDNPLLAASTTINVNSTTGFAISGTIQIESEYIYCTGTTATSFTNCTRGYKGTTAASHISGSNVYQSTITSTGIVGSAQRVVRANVKVDSRGITYFNSASNPADNGSLGTSPVAIIPPASMAAGDLVIMIANSRTSGITLAISATGGQAWTSETAITTNGSMRLFWCRYNGTWTANPSVSFSVTANTTVAMHVFRPMIGANTWALDVTQTTGFFPAPSAPRDVTITGITTIINGALAFFVWSSQDNNRWGLQTAGWTNAGGSQYRNTASADSSQSAAYKIMETAGTTGNVTNRELTAGGGGFDMGNTIKIAFKQVPVKVLLDWQEIFN
ncbi:MAG: hypothetical protein HY034_02225 [Nitrospirae bacterium]|nr:hypothetical protein [Nitrospirota bacterium]